MRVLYLANWIDSSTRLLIEQTAHRGDACVSLLSDCAKSRQQFSERVECLAFRSRGKVDLAAIRELRSRIVAGRFDVVHALSSRFLANALLATRGLERPPAICGFLGHIDKFSKYNPVHRLTYLHPRLAAVSCNCEAVAAPLARSGVPREKVFTIYAGHALREREALPDLGVRGELAIPADALVVGFAGNMRRVKGVDVLLEAALELKEEPSIHWLLVGRIEDARVKRLAEHKDIRHRVHCLGWREDIARLMTAMDIFAMPSRSEGLCRAIMEGMERGLCPVVTSVGGTPELVRDGVDGLVVPPSDAAAFAAAIRRLAHDAALRKSLAARARERIRTEFTLEQMVDQTLSMYQTVLEASKDAVVRSFAPSSRKLPAVTRLVRGAA